jgi:hypothetical protein
VNERAEAFAPASGGFEAALECAGVAFGLGIFLSRSIDRGIGQADHHAPNRSQHAGGFGRANSALILAQSDVQTMVESAFHNPVAALEREHSFGLELFQRETADQINDFPGPLLFLGLRVLALDPGLQSSDQASSRKDHLGGSDFQAFQASDLQTAAVAFPLEDLGLGCGPRGKKAVGYTAFRGFGKG